MSKEFIESAYNQSDIKKASLQEDNIRYFTTSDLQDKRIDENYLSQWAERKYQTNDTFLNWVKTIFKTENFLTFFKYLRYPIPSAKIVKNYIEPQLKRVFNAEDSDFRYSVSGVDSADFLELLEIKRFNKEIFENYLYSHNSILITDLDPLTPNTPISSFIDIKKVVSISVDRNGISKIAFKSSIVVDNKIIPGIAYIDSMSYKFYDDTHDLIAEVNHDLNHTPAHFITNKKYAGNEIVRESIFTYLREELEEYVFLKTLQRMSEPNGVIPILTKVLTEQETTGNRGPDLQPDSDHIMGSQSSMVYSQNEGVGTGDLQPGTIHEIDPANIRNNDGSINMDVVTNWLNFHFTPIEPMSYLNDRIKGLERSIKSAIIGDVVESNEESKNELQIEKSISVLENNLTSLAEEFNYIRKKRDTDMLGLRYGIDRVNEVFIHYGTDFFLDSQTKLFEDLKNAPNSLERKNIIKRINQNRHKNNHDLMSRQMILYDLMPYCSDKDFEMALNTQTVSDINLQYQLRFTYWISQFEVRYGNIVMFWKSLDDLDNAQKLTIINDLIIQLIKDYESISSSNQEG